MTESRSTPRTSNSEPVAALILAAGGASRMGVSKALLDWHGESLIRRAAHAALASRCARVFAIVGSDGGRTASELRDLPVEGITHREWSAGMGSTIAAGIRHLEEAEEASGQDPWSSVVLLLCDQPFIAAAHIDRLCALRESTSRGMAACSFDDTLGPPACFDRSLFAQLKTLTGDRGAKSLLLAEGAEVARLDCPAAAIDVDTLEQYQRALSLDASDFE